MLAVQTRKRKRLHNKISQHQTGEDTNYDIVVKKNKNKADKPKGLTASQKNARRKAKKKQEKLREKKTEREDREKVLTSLEQHALSKEQLTLLHSSSGRRPNALLAKEQVRRAAVIVNHKKKKKKCSSVMKMLNPTEETPTTVSSSEVSSESELEDSVPQTPAGDREAVPETTAVDNVTEKQKETPKNAVKKPKCGVAKVKEQGLRKPSNFIRLIN